jgi:hypothetical protein
MRPKNLYYSMAASDADGIVTGEKPAAGGVQAFTLDGALVSGGSVTLDVPRMLRVASDGDDHARQFTLTGTDRYGNAISEVVTGLNASEAYTVANFATVTGITTDDDTAGTITIGTADAMNGPWIPHDPVLGSLGYSVQLGGNANLAYSVEYTRQNVLLAGFRETGCNALAAGEASSVDTAGEIPGNSTACRIRITDYVQGHADFMIVYPR